MKTIAKRVLSKFGYRLISSHRRMRVDEVFRDLNSKGLRPRTVIDVGVAWGTPELYDAFPNANLVLVEPNQDWSHKIDPVLALREGKVFYVAAGSDRGEVELAIWGEHPGSSTSVQVTTEKDRFTEHRKVPLRRIDALVEESGYPGPFLLKLDIQGAEIDAIRGASGLLDQCDAIVVESSLLSNQPSGDLSSIAALLLEHGFRISDLAGLLYRPSDNALGYVDVIFMKNDHPIRRDRSWN